MHRNFTILIFIPLFLAASLVGVPAHETASGKDLCGPRGVKHAPLVCSHRTSLPLDGEIGTPRGSNIDPVYDKMPYFQYVSRDFDIPIEVNERVWAEVESLQRGPRHVRTVLERGAYYLPMMRQALFEVGCPTDMAYLAMVESNFSPTARSVMDAAGMWQFMASTGEKYGLEITDWIDERLDVEKSSRAAGTFLLDLYDRFGSWPLVLASYNAGPGSVSSAIRRKNTKDFWKLCGTKVFKPETEFFVPKFYGALLVGKYPARFGITKLAIPAEIEYETIKVPPMTDVFVVSKISGANYERLVNLNAQYLYECSPPWPGGWPMRVPASVAEGLEQKIKALEKNRRNAFIRHMVTRGDTLGRIAHRYRMNPRVILQANGYKSWRDIKKGAEIVVPLRKKGPSPVVAREPSVKKENGRYKVRYTIGEGDTMGKIAKTAEVKLEDLYKWNNLKREDLIFPGQTLVIFCTGRGAASKVSSMGEKNRRKNIFATPPSQRIIFHTIKPGESLSHVAHKYNVSLKELVNWNKISDPDRIQVGQRIKIYR